MMRIQFLSHFFPPTHTAGAENYTYNLAREIASRGHEVRVFCAGDWHEGDAYLNGITDEIVDGIPVRRVHLNWEKAPDPNRYLYDNPLAGQLFHDHLLAFRPDIVHITSCYSLSSSVIQTAKDLAIPVVLTLVDFWFICPTLHLIRGDGQLCNGATTARECLRCLLHGQKAYHWPSAVLPDSLVLPILGMASRSAGLSRRPGLRGLALDMDERKRLMGERLGRVDAVIAPSRFLANVHSRLFPHLALRFQAYGHDLSWVVDEGQRIPEVKDGLRFAYIGQISPDKGVDVLIQSFRELSEPVGTGTKLDIWGSTSGEWEYESRLRQLAEGWPRIAFRGRFSPADRGRILDDADVIVVPSVWYENNPLVIQEAFAAGRPVIASNLGSMREFVEHERNGLLFAPGDIDDLAQQMTRLLRDPDLLPQLRLGIPPVKSIYEEAEELLETYARLESESLARSSGVHAL